MATLCLEDIDQDYVLADQKILHKEVVFTGVGKMFSARCNKTLKTIQSYGANSQWGVCSKSKHHQS